MGTFQLKRRTHTPPYRHPRSTTAVSVVDGLAAVLIGWALLASFVLVPGFRSWVAESLAYAWIPVVLWLVSAAISLRYRPRFFLIHWRYWLLFGSAVVLAAGVLSMIEPAPGNLSQIGLGGTWGSKIGGDSWPAAVVKLAAIVMIVPVLLFPGRVGGVWIRALGALGRNLEGFATGQMTRKLYQPLITIMKGIRFVRYGKARPAEKSIIPSHSIGADRKRIPWLGKDRSLGIQEAIESFTRKELNSYSDATPTSSTGVSFRELPGLDLLSEPDVIDRDPEELRRTAGLIERTLESHGVNVHVRQIQAGPRVIRYGLTPGWSGTEMRSSDDAVSRASGVNPRVSVQSILARRKDLALALKTPQIRIQPTIPGESLLGIEIPAATPLDVRLREFFKDGTLLNGADDSGLPMALGKGIDGQRVVADLTELPHMLIAGATGTGKSMCLNAIVASLLFTRSPDQLRMLMVDPKGVELTPYEDVPHMIAPIIVDPLDFNPALEGLADLMHQRYERFRRANVRGIRAYNERYSEPLPFVVLVVDELAELMLNKGRDAESTLVRLAQMGRAAGIHLVLSTQRPTVDVVTGSLKANIGTRIGFAVASQVDSRVILDVAGAETLAGKGDMLMLGQESLTPSRLQGVLVEEDEVMRLVGFWVN